MASAVADTYDTAAIARRWLTDYRAADLVKLQILVNGEPVDALAMLVHRTRAEMRGRAMAEKL